MIKLRPNENDDRDFVAIAEQLLKIGVGLVQPLDVFVVKIDHSFDFKWLTFSHKTLGAVGVWRNDLRIPPFIPDRVIEELHFQKESEKYVSKPAKPLHIYQWSERNMHRKLQLISNSAIFLWLSGETKNNSQASLMMYTTSKDFQNAWYVSFIKKSGWQIYKTKNTSRAEVKAMIENDYLALIR